MSLRFWWASSRERVLRLLFLAAAYASLLGVALPFLLQAERIPRWAIGLGAVSLITLGAFFLLELQADKLQTIYEKDDHHGIRQYMRNWIGAGGRVAIWSRDLTWATTAEMRQLLVQKAKSGELVLCVPQRTGLSQQLADAGAEVCVYGKGDYAPASRFTITEFMRAGSRVAVGRTQGRFHVIDEFDSASHPAFYLAQDLVTLARTAHAAPGGQQ